MRIVVFAKERPGLKEALRLLRKQTDDVIVFKGKVGDTFPRRARNIKCDIIISYISPWVIPASVLRGAKKFAINFHPGPPEYPGIGCSNFAIYNHEKEYGVTAHIMEEAVDTGMIIAAERFPIYLHDTVYSLTQRSYKKLLTLFRKVMAGIFNKNEIMPLEGGWKRRPYTRKQLNDLCRVSLKMDKKEVDRRIRAAVYPDMPGPYLMFRGHKFIYDHEN